MPYDEKGNLIVKTFTAGGSIPIQGAVVRITGVDEENRLVEYSVLTDIDGVTQNIALPAPNVSLSMSPGAVEQSYAKYNVEAIAEGFYPKKIFDIAIFADNSSFQVLEMIPLPINEKSDFYPKGNLRATVQENEYLE